MDQATINASFVCKMHKKDDRNLATHHPATIRVLLHLNDKGDLPDFVRSYRTYLSIQTTQIKDALSLVKIGKGKTTG